MSATLLVLAAGLGSRFSGGIKQLTPVGRNGELLMEYSAYDAAKAGFDKAVYIIRRDIEEQFCELVDRRISKIMPTEYCFQDMEDLPRGFSVPAGRTKPWGTVHAVLAARELINEPFLIVNADDYYGRNAYESAYRYLTGVRMPYDQCMCGFVLENTLSDNGTVTRGVCQSGDNGMLTGVTETYKVSRHDGVVDGYVDGERVILDPKSLVSMNMWGFDDSILPKFERLFARFLSERGDDIMTAEYALPMAADALIRSGEINIKVLPTHDRWYGMTLKEDTEEVREAFAGMIAEGVYPDTLV
ncbi:MAG: nucleotidyltransferase [Ruminococcus sp.]|nr:nucleotidyltransferase [Ruminococcus sp.]MBQ5311544.1 nucleotidyltransferase [Oscillospiraceae bacterium]